MKGNIPSLFLFNPSLAIRSMGCYTYSMEIYLGADHRGWELKNKLGEWLKGKGYAIHDMGAEKLNTEDDYPEYAFKVAEAVAEKPHQRRGIVVCGSGAGMAVAANKVAGVRAVLLHDSKIVEAARRDDDINVLALGADFITEEKARAIITAFLETAFDSNTRHERRVNEIVQYEEHRGCACNHDGCGC